MNNPNITPRQAELINSVRERYYTLAMEVYAFHRSGEGTPEQREEALEWLKAYMFDLEEAGPGDGRTIYIRLHRTPRMR